MIYIHDFARKITNKLPKRQSLNWSDDCTFEKCTDRNYTFFIQPVSSTIFYNENQMISSSDDKTVRLFDFRNMNELERLTCDSSANKLDILCGSSHVALPHDDGNIRLVKMCQSGSSRLRRIRHRNMRFKFYFILISSSRFGCSLEKSPIPH